MPPKSPDAKKSLSLLMHRDTKRTSQVMEYAAQFGLDEDELMRQTKKDRSNGGYVEQRDKKEFLENELSVQDSRLSPEEKQKKQTNNDMKYAIRQCRLKYAMEWCWAGDLPLAYYTEYLLPYLLGDHTVNKQLRDALESGNPPLLNSDWTVVRSSVEISLVELGCKKLESFYTNEQLLWEWIDLLMIGQKYPSRADILWNEKAPKSLEERASTESLKRGSLRDEIVMGRMTDFILTIDVFLEYFAIQRSGRSTRKMPALENIMEAVWMQVDLDGDGTLDVDEAEEVARLILSRPMFGKVLIAMVCNDPNSVNAAAVRDAIPSTVLQAATGVRSIAKEFWSPMDIDGDGEVDEQEFREKFAQAFETAIASPIADKLALVAFDKPVPQEITGEECVWHNAKRSSLELYDGMLKTSQEVVEVVEAVPRNDSQGRSGRSCTSPMSECEESFSCGRRQTSYYDPTRPIRHPYPAAAHENLGPSSYVAQVDDEVKVDDVGPSSYVAKVDDEVEEWEGNNCQEASQAGCKTGCSIM